MIKLFFFLLLLTGCSVLPTSQSPAPSGPSINTPAAGQATPLLLPDQIIAGKILNAINHDPVMVGAHLKVSVKNGNVLLRGTCVSINQALQADAIAGDKVGVKRVIDDISAPGRT
ncbi:MAG: BON domain-containing protein [Pseudomonadota bacterium]|nr:BON domain-containing protein [Pseudomonadota bacterium]